MHAADAPSSDPVLADPPPLRRGGLARLIGWASPAGLTLYLVWGVLGPLLALQVEALDPGAKVQNLAVVTTIGATAALLTQPVVGVLSDRTRSRYGRRARWMVGGAVAGLFALGGLALADNLWLVAVTYLLVNVAFNATQASFFAVLPDRVPHRSRGTYAAITGLGTMIGIVGGTGLASGFAESIGLGYVVAGALTVVGVVAFVVLNPDHPSTDQVNPPLDARAVLRTYWVSPVAHPDFFWAFSGRFLLYSGYFIVSAYQLYLLQDYIGLGADAVSALPVMSGLTAVGLLVSMGVSGPLSDRLGRRKIFVFVSTLLVASSTVIPLVWPTYEGWAVMSLLIGLGYGSFQAVDQALVSQVLPSQSEAGKDLGIVNIAATLPQAIAPAVAGLVVTFAGYAAIFPVSILLAVVGAFAVWPIKSVR